MYKYLIVDNLPLVGINIPMIVKGIESPKKLPAFFDGFRMMKVNELGWSAYVDLVEKTDDEWVLLDVWRDYQ